MMARSCVTVGEPVVDGAMYVKPALRVAVPPSVLVTVTTTTPATDAGVRTESVVEVDEATVPAVSPNLTTTPDLKPLPVMVTSVLPAVGPLAGEMAAIVGGVTAGSTYVYAAAIVTEPPSGLATVIVTGPAALAGAIALIEVDVPDVTAPATPPKRQSRLPGNRRH